MTNHEALQDIVLITGADGLIGTAITQCLADNYRIVGLNRRCPSGKIDCVLIDISSAERIEEALREVREKHGARFASVIHLAAYYDFSGEKKPLYDTVNVLGTQRLLQGLQQFDVEQFVYASTMLVHAPTQPGKPITEESPLQPKWPYPQSKLEAEKIVFAERGRIPVVVLRIAGVYTDFCQSPTLAQQIQRIYERQFMSYLLPADPSHGQAAVHLDDLAAVFPALLRHRHELPPELALLIGEPQTMSYDDIQDKVGHLLYGTADWETYKIPKSIAKTGAWLQNKLEDVVPNAIDKGKEPFVKPFMVDLAEDHFELDISRARQLLGWEPRHSLYETLPKMIAALQSDPIGWYRKNKLDLPSWLEQAAEQPDESARLAREYETWHRQEHQRTLWAHFVNMVLGLWLVTSPVILGYTNETPMLISDMVSGVLVMLFAGISLSRRQEWARWGISLVGLWLLFAPLVFWTHSAGAYTTDTLVGTLIIIFAFLIPPEPGVSVVARMRGPDVPPGWDYCPSTWMQRIPVIALALVGLFVSRYLAAYQLGHTQQAWDPFFGKGTEDIITSEVSKAWPIPDAGLGAVTYILEILSGAMGGKQRWRTMPWMVILFGILIVPLGVTSIFFIIIQPTVIGTWCTLCLIAALAMLVQIPYSLDEVLATAQFLKERVRSGKPFWRTFLRGDIIEGGSEDRSATFESSPFAVARDIVGGGVNIPWPLLAVGAIGIWLMFTRLTFGTESTMADSDHIVGSLVVTFSIIAWAEVARPVRFINVLFGFWLCIAPWVFTGDSTAATWNSVICGLLLILLSLPRGPVKSRYGNWNRYIV